MSWSDIENQWIYAEDVQIDELIKNFHQQYFNKLSINASNAKQKRIEKNWFNQRREEFYFNWHEVESQLNYQLFFEIQRQIKHLNIVVIVKTTKKICNVFQKKLIFFVSFYELTIHIIDIFSINFLSLSCREIRAENNTLTLKNLRRNDLITHRDSSVNQLEDRIFKSNKNLMLLEENLQKNANRKHIEMQACFCLEHLAHAISITRRQDIETRQHLTQLENSSSFLSMSSSSSFFSSATNRSINDSSRFVSTMFRRREVFEIREEERTTTLRSDVVTRVTKERRSRVEFEIKTENSSITRRCSWFFIFFRKFRRRFSSLARNSSKSRNSSNVVDSFAMMTTDSITKVEMRIEDEFTTISAAKTFDDSVNEEINVVNKRIRTFRFISSKIESVTESIDVTEIIENAEMIEDAEMIENAEMIEDAEMTEDVNANVTEDAKIMSDIESTTKRWSFDFVSTFSESRRDEREFKNVLSLIIFLERSKSRLIISFLEEAEDFVLRERREIVMLTMK